MSNNHEIIHTIIIYYVSQVFFKGKISKRDKIQQGNQEIIVIYLSFKSTFR